VTTYTVFTPFHRVWFAEPRREVLIAPRALAAPSSEVAAGRLPSLAELGLDQRCEAPMPGGEGAGRAALARFVRRRVAD
jgi:hypothetical protein